MMKWLSGMSRRSLALIALVLGFVILLAVNMISQETLRMVRGDVTENRLFTLTDSTRKVIANVKDPITVKLYYSEQVGVRAPVYGQYAARVQALLQHYSSLSKGMIRFEKISPEAFSDEEDRAVAAGMTPVRLSAQEKGYLGIHATNSTDDEETIPFLSMDRANFLEYDLTRLVHKLSRPERKSIGLLTGLDMNGAMGPTGRPQPPWLIIRRLEEFFNVRTVAATEKALPTGLDVLIVASPPKLSDELAASIEQFALSGKPVIVLADPFSETNRRNPDSLKKEGQNLIKLMKAWGVSIDPDKVVGDADHPRRIQFNRAGQPVIIDYLIWLTLGKKTYDVKSPMFANMERLVMASVGSLDHNKEAGTKFEPLVKSSSRSMVYPLKDIAPPDPIRLVNTFLADNTPKVLAARVSGSAKAVFTPAKDQKDAKKDGSVNVIVIADSDFLFDSFWAQVRQIAGRQVVVPVANNPDLLLNALEMISGGAALAGLRGRGIEDRPFTRVDAIRRQAEARFRKREQALNQKLSAAQKKLSEIQSKAQKGEVLLSDEDKQAILGFRQEVVAIRQDLRNVKRALNHDIEQLEFRVQFVNTAGVALLIGIGGLLFAAVRRRRRK